MKNATDSTRRWSVWSTTRACRQRQQEHRDEFGEADPGQRKRRSHQVVHLPADGDRLDHDGEGRDDPDAQVEPEVAVRGKRDQPNAMEP